MAREKYTQTHFLCPNTCPNKCLCRPLIKFYTPSSTQHTVNAQPPHEALCSSKINALHEHNVQRMLEQSRVSHAVCTDTGLHVGSKALSPPLLAKKGKGTHCALPSLSANEHGVRARAVSPWVLRTVTKGYVLQFAHPPPRFAGTVESVVQDNQKHILTGGKKLTPAKRSHSDCAAEQNGSGVLQPLFSGAEKKRKLAPHSRPPCLKQTFDKEKIQNAHTSPTGQGYSPKRLVCNTGLKVSLFSQSHTLQTQKVSALCLPRSGVRVQGPAIRAFTFAKSFYKMRGSCNCSAAPPGGMNLQLPRRLALLLQFKGGSLLSCHNGAVSSQEAGLYCELCEKYAYSSANSHFSGNGAGFQGNACPLVARANTDHHDVCQAVQSRTASVLALLPEVTGADGICNCSPTYGPTAHEAFSDLVHRTQVSSYLGQ